MQFRLNWIIVRAFRVKIRVNIRVKFKIGLGSVMVRVSKITVADDVWIRVMIRLV